MNAEMLIKRLSSECKEAIVGNQPWGEHTLNEAREAGILFDGYSISLLGLEVRDKLRALSALAPATEKE